MYLLFIYLIFLFLAVITDIFNTVKESKENGCLAKQIMKNFNLS